MRLALTTGLLAVTVQAETIYFDGTTPGAAPPGWTATKTGKGEANWTIDLGAAKHVKHGCLRARARAPASSRLNWTGSISPFRIATVATPRFAFASRSERAQRYEMDHS